MSGYTEAAEAVTLPAGEDLTGDLYKAAKINSSGQVAVATAVGDTVAGIIGEEVDTVGDATQLVLLKGIVKVKAGDTITAGHIAVLEATTGQPVGVASLAAIPVDQMALGIWLEGGADGEVLSMLAMPIASPHTA